MRTLYSKFLLFTLITMIGSALLAFLIVNTYYHQFLKADNDAKNMRILGSMTEFVESNPDIDIQAYLESQGEVGYKLYLAWRQEDQILTESFGQAFRLVNLPQAVIEDVLDGEAYHGMRDLPKESFVTGFFSDELANSVGQSFTLKGQTYALFLRPNIKLLFTEVHYLISGLFLGMGLISLVAMLLIAHKLIRPLRKLTLATKNIREGQFEIPTMYKSSDEIGQLARSFEQMTEELEKVDQMQKQFISDVSHDLQTPLQQMKGYAALIREQDLPEAEVNDYLQIIERESDRLSKLSRQLLVISSLDMKQATQPINRFRLDEQIRQIIYRFRWQLEQKNISLTADLHEVSIRGIEGFIELIWENLLSNAIKYSPSGSDLSISLTEEEERIRCAIQDQGIGIQEAAIPKVFDRFYRVDEARHSNIEGTGLGLAIVKSIVDLHEGSIHLKSQVNVGTEVIVYLPKV